MMLTDLNTSTFKTQQQNSLSGSFAVKCRRILDNDRLCPKSASHPSNQRTSRRPDHHRPDAAPPKSSTHSAAVRAIHSVFGRQQSSIHKRPRTAMWTKVPTPSDRPPTVSEKSTAPTVAAHSVVSSTASSASSSGHTSPPATSLSSTQCQRGDSSRTLLWNASALATKTSRISRQTSLALPTPWDFRHLPPKFIFSLQLFLQ